MKKLLPPKSTGKTDHKTLQDMIVVPKKYLKKSRFETGKWTEKFAIYNTICLRYHGMF